MPLHPFASIDREDRRQAYAEARIFWATVGCTATLAVIAVLVFSGVV